MIARPRKRFPPSMTGSHNAPGATAALLLVVLIGLSSLSRAQWTPGATGLPSGEGVLSFAAVDQQRVWGIGLGSAWFIRSTTGGTQWIAGQVSDSIGRSMACITAFDADTAWVAMYSPAGSVLRTTDGGSTWQRQPTAFPGAGAFPNIVHFLDARQGLCIGNPNDGYFEIYTTTNSGANWVRVPAASIPSPLAGEMGNISECAAAGTTVWFGTTRDRIFKTTDVGLTWTATRVGFGQPGEEKSVTCAFADTSHGLAADGDQVAMTIDGGATWLPVAHPEQPASWVIRHVKGTRASYMMTAFSPGSPGSAFTLNGGATWSTVDAIDHLHAAFATPGAGWCGGTSGGVVYAWAGPPLETEQGSCIVVSPLILTYDLQPVGTTSEPKTIHIFNSGEDTLVIDDIIGPGSDFALINAPQLPLRLPGMQAFHLGVSFSPQADGTTVDSIVIVSNAPNNPTARITLNAQGIVMVASQPGPLYAASDSLFQIDIATLAATRIGPLGGAPMQGLAIRPSDHFLYGASTSLLDTRLFRICSATAFAWAVCAFPIPNMRAIAFNAGDTLYGATISGRLYRIELSTGDTVYIGTAPSTPYSGLAFRPGNSELWGSVRAGISGRDRIYKVNTTTGASTLVGSTGDHQITPSIAFAPSGVLYGLKGSGTGVNTLIQIDTNNAAGTLLGYPGLAGLLSIAMRTDAGPVWVDDRNPNAPHEFLLHQNHPSPFNPSTLIEYQLPVSARVTLTVYDILGREVATLVSGHEEAGYKSVRWDAGGAPSGVYFYQLRAGTFVGTRKTLVVR
jgi:photosystem II stability/assembly factor-like uncharacterized protein